MKAYVLHGVDGLRLEETEMPVIGPGEVLVEVRASGVCGSDIPRIYQTGAYSHPLIPGHEFSGVVAETGLEASKSWKGRRVGVSPLIPCGKCGPCKQGSFELCRDYSYLGSRRDGGFAEYVAVPERNLIALPENVSFEAAAMLEPMAVAVHALRSIPMLKEYPPCPSGANAVKQRGWEKSGLTVTVCGLGTIGILLTMFLQELGVEKLFTIGNKGFQKELVEGLGIHSENYCNNSTGNAAQWMMEKTDGRGTDIFFECAGGEETIIEAITCTAPGGRVQMIGNPVSDIHLKKQDYWKILRNQLTINGSWNSTFMHSDDDDWNYVLGRLAEGKISPEQFITHKLEFKDMEKGLHIMRDKTDGYVKVMACLH